MGTRTDPSGFVRVTVRLVRSPIRNIVIEQAPVNWSIGQLKDHLIATDIDDVIGRDGIDTIRLVVSGHILADSVRLSALNASSVLLHLLRTDGRFWPSSKTSSNEPAKHEIPVNPDDKNEAEKNQLNKDDCAEEVKEIVEEEEQKNVDEDKCDVYSQYLARMRRLVQPGLSINQISEYLAEEQACNPTMLNYRTKLWSLLNLNQLSQTNPSPENEISVPRPTENSVARPAVIVNPAPIQQPIAPELMAFFDNLPAILRFSIFIAIVLTQDDMNFWGVGLAAFAIFVVVLYVRLRPLLQSRNARTPEPVTEGNPQGMLNGLRIAIKTMLNFMVGFVISLVPNNHLNGGR